MTKMIALTAILTVLLTTSAFANSDFSGRSELRQFSSEFSDKNTVNLKINSYYRAINNCSKVIDSETCNEGRGETTCSEVEASEMRMGTHPISYKMSCTTMLFL